MSKRALLVGLALSVVALAYACTIRDVTGVAVASIQVQPGTVLLLEGGTQRFTAQARDASGRTLPGGAITWSSDDPTTFSVDGEGNGEALLAGQATIWATLEGTRGSASVQVEPGPSLAADQSSLSFFGNLGGEAPEPLTLRITNGGGGTLGGVSAAVEYPQGGATGWLSLALAGTSAPTTLTLSILIGFLDQGTHAASLVLTSPDARNSPLVIPVQVAVSLDRPIIGLSRSSLQLQAEAGGDLTTLEVVQISNRGGGTLSGLDASPLYFGVGGWLSADLTSKTAPAELRIQADPSGLSPGTYNAEVRVTGSDALNTPQSLAVALSVADAVGADASVAKTGPAQATKGDTLLYLLTVSNAGPGSARGLVLEDSLPVGVIFLDASEGGQHTSGVVSWDVGVLSEGSTSVDSVWVIAENKGIFTNVAILSSTSEDPRRTNNRATYATTVTGADLAVSKTAPVTAAAGDQISYTLTAQNLGPINGEGVLLVDTLPAGVSFVSATGGGAWDGTVGPAGVVRWALGNLTQAAGLQSFQVVVDIGAGTTGAITNILSIEPFLGDPVPGNNLRTAVTSLGASAELVVGKSAPATGIPGTQISYAVTVQNNGPSDATGVVLTDTLPLGVTFVSASGGGSYDGGVGPNGVVTWDMGAVGVATGLVSFDLVVDIDAATTGAVVNTAAVTSATPELDLTDNLVTAATTVTGSDLVVAKSASATTADPGGQITYTVSVQNTGPSDATGVVLTDTLPSGVVFVSATGGGVHDGAPSGGLVTWTIGDLTVAAGLQSFDLVVDIESGTVGAIRNAVAASSTSTDPDPSDDLATVSTDVQSADLSVGKTGPASAAPGAPLTYTLTVQNAGLSDATGVVLTDTLPATATFVSASGGGTHDGSPTGGVVTWNVGALTVAAGPQIFTVTASTAAGASGTINNAAEVSATQFDPVTGNNYAQIGTPLVPSTDIQIVKSGPVDALPGEQIVYTITVDNLGPSDATGIRIKDLLPGSVTFASASGSYAILPGDTVAWDVDSLTVAEAPPTFTLTVDIRATTSGTVINRALVSSTTADPVLANNDSIWSTLVNAADVSITKTAIDDGTPTVGEGITYELLVANAGPSIATGITVTDVLPGGVSFVSATGSGSEAGGTVTWAAIPTLAVGSDTTLVIQVDIDSAETLTNTASVTSTSNDTNGINDSNTAITHVPSPALSTASVPATGTAGAATDITVQARDGSGNAIAATGQAVVITVTGSNAATPTVTDAGGGTYTASYTPTVAGSDNIAITMNGTAVSGSPFTSTISAGALDETGSTATVPATGTAGAATAITVQARDGSGNAIAAAGQAVVVTVTGSNAATPAVTDVGDGTYTASYTPTVAGSDNIAITMNGIAVSGSPFTSTISAGALSEATSTATVPATGTAGAATAITVQARDGSGNAIAATGQAVVISVTGANTATPTVTDVGDGTYTASYTPVVGGGLDDTITITMNGIAISGSPFTSNVSGLAPTLGDPEADSTVFRTTASTRTTRR